MKGLFIFRRDLRLNDNTGLLELSKRCTEVNAIFILDPRQIDPKQNKFFSAPAMLFMLDTLIEMQRKAPIKVLHGDPYEIIKSMKDEYDLIFYNKDYSKYALERDAKLDGLGCVGYDDIGLNAPTDLKPYKVFTPYYEAAKKIKVRPPGGTAKNIKDFKSRTVDLYALRDKIERVITDVQKMDIELIQKGGRANGLKCIKRFDENAYSKNRDLLTFETSRLSPHLKFGTVSAREVYHECAKKAAGIFRKQLYWRDFYMQIGFHFPKVYGNNFKGNIKWKNDRKQFEAWCKGETGFDIVDACMFQLNKSGFMHNRGRMIVASFLTKILHIDWRWGERYFASRLTDYDPANNNGGWQWSAGTGVDAQPYFRIFNPYTQAEKFDPDGTYRKKWLAYRPDGDGSTVEEIVDYVKEREVALKLVVK